MVDRGRSRPYPWLALACGALPIVSIHLGYLISIAADNAVACIPYLEGCVSISAANREPPAVWLFRVTMIPEAFLLAWLWSLCSQWLIASGDPRRARIQSIRLSGMVGALFLILYASFLGTEGEFYTFLRRFGATLFFALTYLAQLLFTYRIMAGIQKGRLTVPGWVWKGMFGTTMLLLGGGLTSIPVQHYFDINAVENAIEWGFALLMMVYFFLVAALLRSVRV